ncbi:MAG TPA: alpha/beta hydrolase [Anaerovoracaceae bacterium]|nr:alpha/beta hydrolase [Anaerovoracaceae bacterium]
MIKTTIFLILVLIGIVFLLGGIVLMLIKRFKRGNNITVKKIKSKFVISLISIILAVGLLFISQLFAKTPVIDDAEGTSISELIKIDVNGREEWISIRGNDINNPVILFLAGGPGGTQLGAVRRNLKELENDFVIANWEQPGSGKSYGAMPIDEIGPKTYISDGEAVTDYLLDRFDKEKIYIIGESWGSALGIFLADKNPEKYHAFIGTGQMVDFEETEVQCYNLALELAEKRDDSEKVDELKELGEPPYSGENMALDAAKYLQYLSDEMARNPNIENGGYETFSDLASSEYGILDQINFFRGVVTTFSQVYPQLYGVDLREDYNDIEIPVRLFIGRHDINAPTYLAEEYYEVLDSPDKELVYFEKSGHSPWINEYELFCEKTKGFFVFH